MIGRSGNSEYRLGYCAVAQARMWNVARTEDEIKADMCKFFAPEEAKNNANLLGYWVPSNGVSDISVFKTTVLPVTDWMQWFTITVKV